MRSIYCFLSLPVFILFFLPVHAQEKQLDFTTQIRPVLDKHCFSCHNVGKVAGGINLEKYESEGSLIENGEVWLKVIKQVQSGQMPPSHKPTPSPEEHDIIVKGINKILINSLAENNPGRVVIRRLSHNEYQYTIMDLVGVEFDAKNNFPADGSGGGGFDNYSRTLFVTPLKFERYYEAAEFILQKAYNDQDLWNNIVPFQYEQRWWEQIGNWTQDVFYEEYTPFNSPVAAAESVIYPFASKAFRRFLKNEDKEKFIGLFQKVYEGLSDKPNPERFNLSILEALKAVLVSPNYLYRIEEESPYNGPYALSNFELASRLSFFLWSSMPDEELFQVAYREDLHDPRVLNKQVTRMLNDPKAKRFAESFVTQWLGIAKLKESSPVDPEKFPEFTPNLRQAMYQQTVEFFYHCMTESKTFLDLLDSDYTFLNEDLANHYGIEGVQGDAFRKVSLMKGEGTRGGVLGMGSVLASTSLPLRTSPVLRGKWVLEEILGTPPPPPPPDVGELPEEANTGELSFRNLLAVHRNNPACMSCHMKMDPIGLGLENFDAIGRWRNSYEKDTIDASGVLASGESFEGPNELKQILLEKKETFARNLSEKMFTYATGRSIQFVDEPTLQKLQKSLLDNNFNPEKFIIELVNSYAFRYKVNDYSKKLNES